MTIIEARQHPFRLEAVQLLHRLQATYLELNNDAAPITIDGDPCKVMGSIGRQYDAPDLSIMEHLFTRDVLDNYFYLRGFTIL